jgi:hypothetical protein
VCEQHVGLACGRAALEHAVERTPEELHDLDVRAAMDRLSGDGLVNLLGDRVGVSRAAARFDQLRI